MEEKYPDLYPNAVEVARKLADWQKIHRSLFQIALCGALGLADNPYRCSTDLLHVTLAINPRPISSSDAASAFIIVKTEVRPIAPFLASENETEDMRAPLAAACKDLESQTARFRERNPDAPGVCLLIAYLEQYNMTRIVPVTVSDSPRLYGKIYALWEDIFHTYTAQGRRL
ncbi:hypothetical protein K523DRAFT_325628 [Schizophyllum commune Tattone D]|nr:hypothetical protein K523DRAFT_325628 [Schizophyllum commune Tattone D]